MGGGEATVGEQQARLCFCRLARARVVVGGGERVIVVIVVIVVSGVDGTCQV